MKESESQRKINEISWLKRHEGRFQTFQRIRKERAEEEFPNSQLSKNLNAKSQIKVSSLLSVPVLSREIIERVWREVVNSNWSNLSQDESNRVVVCAREELINLDQLLNNKQLQSIQQFEREQDEIRKSFQQCIWILANDSSENKDYSDGLLVKIIELIAHYSQKYYKILRDRDEHQDIILMSCVLLANQCKSKQKAKLMLQHLKLSQIIEINPQSNKQIFYLISKIAYYHPWYVEGQDWHKFQTELNFILGFLKQGAMSQFNQHYPPRKSIVLTASSKKKNPFHQDNQQEQFIKQILESIINIKHLLQTSNKPLQSVPVSHEREMIVYLLKTIIPKLVRKLKIEELLPNPEIQTLEASLRFLRSLVKKKRVMNEFKIMVPIKDSLEYCAFEHIKEIIQTAWEILRSEAMQDDYYNDLNDICFDLLDIVMKFLRENISRSQKVYVEVDNLEHYYQSQIDRFENRILTFQPQEAQEEGHNPQQIQKRDLYRIIKIFAQHINPINNPDTCQTYKRIVSILFQRVRQFVKAGDMETSVEYLLEAIHKIIMFIDEYHKEQQRHEERAKILQGFHSHLKILADSYLEKDNTESRIYQLLKEILYDKNDGDDKAELSQQLELNFKD